MPASSSIIKRLNLAVLTCLLFGLQSTPGQTPADSKNQDRPEVLSVYTNLVQTDVMVFDRQGNFVNGLKREDFELRIDGKSRPVEFFEKVSAGSISEEAQIAAARGSSLRSGHVQLPGPTPLDRGRPIFFYVDDLHLNQSSLVTTRKLITQFIEKDMGQNDEAAIASASGQIGFLQQLTDNKTVLRAALQRLKLRPYAVRDIDRPAMSEYNALLISNNDREVSDYFVDEMLRQNPGLTRESAAGQINTRAQMLLRQAGNVTANTLGGLEGLIRSANKLPGRKLVFFISDGFFLDDRNSDSLIRLQRITSSAARSGVVIYSMDARGLVASLTDASTDSSFDPGGRLVRAAHGELSASQDSLNALAHDTGGKAIFNTNSLEPGLGRALKETTSYYLLAWQPELETQHASKFRRIEVKVAGKPDFVVKVRRGFFDIEPGATATIPAKVKPAGVLPMANQKTEETELKKVMLEPYPRREIPVSLILSYVNTPAKGMMLSAAMQVPTEFLSFAKTANEKQIAIVDVVGTFFNDRGMAGAGFNNRITVESPSIEAAQEGNGVFYDHSVFLGPGLYQVRVAAHDEKSGRSGSAHAWIEIPNLASGQLALSSLIVGLRTQPTGNNTSTNSKEIPDSVAVSVTRHFTPDNYLRFLVFVYNAALASADSKPDAAIQVQVVRDEQPVVTTVLKKISIEGIADLGRIPYAAEISLKGLPLGRYILKVTAVDRVAKSSASQQTRFDID